MSLQHRDDALERELVLHAGFVRSLARALVVDPATADDVSQQALYAALTRRPCVVGGLRSWFRRVVGNFAREARRRDKRRDAREQRAAQPEGLPSTEEIVAREQETRRLVHALFSLPEPARSTLVLHFYDGVTPAELARRLGVPAATVRSRVHRAIEQLRHALIVDCGGDERRWMAALASLAGVALPPSAAAVPLVPLAVSARALVLGGLVVSKKLLLMIGVVTAVIVSLVTWQIVQPSASPARTTRAGDNPVELTEHAAAFESPSPVHVERSLDAPARGANPTKDEPARSALLVGRIVTEGGAPLGKIGVEVAAELTSTDGGTDTVHASATTDADGRFRVADLAAPAVVTLRARPDEWCDVVQSVRIDGAGTVDLGTLTARRGGSVRGTVRDEGGAVVADAAVEASVFLLSVDSGGLRVHDDLEHASRHAVSDTRGEYEIRGLEAGDVTVRARAAGRVGDARATGRIDPQSSPCRIDLVLGGQRHRGGHVVDDVGVPVAHARVEIRRAASTDPGAVVESDSSGHFDWVAPATGTCQFWAGVAGHVADAPIFVEPDGPDPVLRLDRTGTLLITLRAPAGRTLIEPVEVRARCANSRISLRVTRDAASFRIDELTSEQVELEIDAVGCARPPPRNITVPRGQETATTIDLAEESSVSGRVVDALGEAVADATVTASDPGARAPFMATSDEKGVYRIGRLGAGRFELVARHPDHCSSAPREVEVQVGERVDRVDFALVTGGTLEGRVVDERGQPIAGATVNVRRLPKADAGDGAVVEATPVAVRGSLLDLLTDVTGRFERAGLATGSYAVRIVGTAGRPRPRVLVETHDQAVRPDEVLAEIRAGETTSVELRGGIAATLVGAVSCRGAPLLGVKVLLTSPEESGTILVASITRTNADGEFRFEHVERGRFAVRIAPPGASDCLVQTVDVEHSGEQRVDFALRGGRVTGTVVAATDASSVPPNGTVVVARPHGASRRGPLTALVPEPTGGVSMSPNTLAGDAVKIDEAGRFSFELLAEGEYSIVLQDPEFVAEPRLEVTVKEGADVDIGELVATRGAVLSLRIVCDAADVDYCFLSLRSVDFGISRQGGGRPARLPDDHSDRIELRGLPTGKYRVFAQDPLLKRTAEQDVDLVAGETTELEMTLKPKS